MPRKVLVADDHPLVREGLRKLLAQAGFSIVAEAKDGDEALRKARELKPELVLWDLLMPGGGLTGLRRLREELPEVKVLVLTALDTPGLSEEIRRAGAHGFVEKTANPEELLSAINTVLRGEVCFPQESNLTAREQEILGLLAHGLSLAEIAEKLKISQKTVESHLENLKGKLGCRSVPELRALALRLRTPTDSPSPPG
ncbi:MAG: response regulator transcription factor, partial [Candidatus Bipolaricaulota bacterium]|nr:response regulator transcription factor [Candidatus Bipolaricaulota bacterium]MDW8127334.1 response regulator transcription factor [Candidatus Bipolaricaulota bacterium]